MVDYYSPISYFNDYMDYRMNRKHHGALARSILSQAELDFRRPISSYYGTLDRVDRALRNVNSNVDDEITYRPAKSAYKKKTSGLRQEVKDEFGRSSESPEPEAKTAGVSGAPAPDVSDTWWWTSRRYPYNRTMQDLRDDLEKERKIGELVYNRASTPGPYIHSPYPDTYRYYDYLSQRDSYGYTPSSRHYYYYGRPWTYSRMLAIAKCPIMPTFVSPYYYTYDPVVRASSVIEPRARSLSPARATSPFRSTDYEILAADNRNIRDWSMPPLSPNRPGYTPYLSAQRSLRSPTPPQRTTIATTGYTYPFTKPLITNPNWDVDNYTTNMTSVTDTRTSAPTYRSRSFRKAHHPYPGKPDAATTVANSHRERASGLIASRNRELDRMEARREERRRKRMAEEERIAREKERERLANRDRRSNRETYEYVRPSLRSVSKRDADEDEYEYEDEEEGGGDKSSFSYELDSAPKSSLFKLENNDFDKSEEPTKTDNVEEEPKAEEKVEEAPQPMEEAKAEEAAVEEPAKVEDAEPKEQEMKKKKKKKVEKPKKTEELPIPKENQVEEPPKEDKVEEQPKIEEAVQQESNAEVNAEAPAMQEEPVGQTEQAIEVAKPESGDKTEEPAGEVKPETVAESQDSPAPGQQQEQQQPEESVQEAEAPPLQPAEPEQVQEPAADVGNDTTADPVEAAPPVDSSNAAEDKVDNEPAADAVEADANDSGVSQTEVQKTTTTSETTPDGDVEVTITTTTTTTTIIDGDGDPNNNQEESSTVVVVTSSKPTGQTLVEETDLGDSECVRMEFQVQEIEVEPEANNNNGPVEE